MTDEDSTNHGPESNPRPTGDPAGDRAGDRVGELLADAFELLEELGAGARGTVYRARTRQPLAGLRAGSEVAIKVLRSELVADERARQQLLREGTLGLAVQSPHVTRIFAVESREVRGVALSYLVMEYVRGRTLRRFLLESGPAVGDLPRRIGQHAALGLDALHQRGVVHRDIKPENLILTEDSALKLMDLGLARTEAAIDTGASGTATAGGSPGAPSSGGFYGSLAYAAPEVLRGRPASPASDLYALGLVLFEVLTGGHPFAKCRGDEMLHAHLRRKPPRPSHLQPRVSPFMDHLVGELLSKDPDSRLGDAARVARILELGEASDFWQEHEKRAPVLASERRSQAMRRSRYTPFVDRRAERRQLDRRLREALRGHGSAVWIVGAAGSGRRRLCDESIERWLRRHEDVYFVGGVAEDRPTTPRGTPFRQILLDWLLRGDAQSAPQLHARLSARIVDAFGWSEADTSRLVDSLVGAGGGVPAAARADLMARALCDITGRHRATVVRVDDAERLDTSGRLVVERLCAAAPTARLLVLLVARQELQPGADSERREAGGAPRTLRLGGLGAPDFQAFGERLFRRGHAPTARIESACTTLSGNPGMLLESLEDLAQLGALRGRPGDFHELTDVAEIRPARPALARLKSRIGDLPAHQRFILEAAAVLGRRFAVQDLAALTGRPELEVLEALSVFDNRIVQTLGGAGSFRHRDYQLATIAATPADARRRLHRAAAWVLEDRGARPLEVGMHLSRALEHNACLDPLLDGLERLAASGSRRAARRVAERIRLHLDRLPRDADNLGRRLRWLLLAGRVHAETEERGRALRAYRHANLIAGHLDRPVDNARALCGLAELAQADGQFFAAVQLLGHAEDLLAMDDGHDARRTVAHVYGVHGRVMAYQGQCDQALKLVRQGLRRVPDDALDLRAHLSIDLARWEALRGDFPAALRTFDRVAELVGGRGDPMATLRLSVHRGRTLGFLGLRDPSTRELAEAERLAARLSDRRMRGRAKLFQGELAAYGGERALAAPLLREALRDARAVGDQVTAELAWSLLRVVADDAPGARPGSAPGQDSSIPVVALTARLCDAVLVRRAGDADRAGRILDEALRIERGVRVHLLLRLALRRASGRDRQADRLVRGIAIRLPAGAARRHFVQFASRVGLE